MEDKNQRFETLKARGAALLLFAECQDYAGPLERLKAFTGGDTIVAERKNSTERFDFTFRGLVLLVGNSAEKAKDDSSAVFNRRRSIHLNQAVPVADRRDMLSWRCGRRAPWSDRKRTGAARRSAARAAVLPDG